MEKNRDFHHGFDASQNQFFACTMWGWKSNDVLWFSNLSRLEDEIENPTIFIAENQRGPSVVAPTGGRKVSLEVVQGNRRRFFVISQRGPLTRWVCPGQSRGFF